jgi:hypothetical protein
MAPQEAVRARARVCARGLACCADAEQESVGRNGERRDDLDERELADNLPHMGVPARTQLHTHARTHADARLQSDLLRRIVVDEDGVA